MDLEAAAQEQMPKSNYKLVPGKTPLSYIFLTTTLKSRSLGLLQASVCACILTPELESHVGVSGYQFSLLICQHPVRIVGRQQKGVSGFCFGQLGLLRWTIVHP